MYCKLRETDILVFGEAARTELTVRILVINGKHLFGEGLNALLEQWSEFELIGPVVDEREGGISEQIELLRPDVVIMGCPDDESDPTPALMRCLRNGWVQKIITVNLQDNTMCVFTSQRRVVEEVGNLAEAITGGD